MFVEIHGVKGQQRRHDGEAFNARRSIHSGLSTSSDSVEPPFSSVSLRTLKFYESQRDSPTVSYCRTFSRRGALLQDFTLESRRNRDPLA